MRPEWREAALAGDTGTLGRMLASGADVDALDRYGQTALMLAALHGHAAALRCLVEAGAALDRHAKFGLTALMLAVVNHHAEAATLLVRAGADLTPRGSGAPGFAGATALDLAERSGQEELAETLRAAGDGPG